MGPLHVVLHHAFDMQIRTSVDSSTTANLFEVVQNGIVHDDGT